MNEQRPSATEERVKPTGDRAAEPGRADAALTPAAEESSGGIVSHLQNVAGPVADVIGSLVEAAGQAMAAAGDSAIARRLGLHPEEPLANLYELHPEVRQASRRELGLRFVPIEKIRGTAVAGADQRGGDFLPLKAFRSENWVARWERIRGANERLKTLPPVDLIKYRGEYWVEDGHNRVAAVLYDNGVGVDAMVTEMVPLDGQVSERPRNLLSYLGENAELRAAAGGDRPAFGLRQLEQASADEAAVIARATEDESSDIWSDEEWPDEEESGDWSWR